MGIGINYYLWRIQSGPDLAIGPHLAMTTEYGYAAERDAASSKSSSTSTPAPPRNWAASTEPDLAINASMAMQRTHYCYPGQRSAWHCLDCRRHADYFQLPAANTARARGAATGY